MIDLGSPDNVEPISRAPENVFPNELGGIIYTRLGEDVLKKFKDLNPTLIELVVTGTGLLKRIKSGTITIDASDQAKAVLLSKLSTYQNAQQELSLMRTSWEINDIAKVVQAALATAPDEFDQAARGMQVNNVLAGLSRSQGTLQDGYRGQRTRELSEETQLAISGRLTVRETQINDLYSINQGLRTGVITSLFEKKFSHPTKI